MVLEAVRQLAAKTCREEGEHSCAHSSSVCALSLSATFDPITPPTAIPLYEEAITCSPSFWLSPLKRICGCMSPQEKDEKVRDWLIRFWGHLGLCQHQITAKYSSHCVMWWTSHHPLVCPLLGSKACNFPWHYKSNCITAVKSCLLTLRLCTNAPTDTSNNQDLSLHHRIFRWNALYVVISICTAAPSVHLSHVICKKYAELCPTAVSQDWHLILRQ